MSVAEAIAERIERKLRENLAPSRLEVADDSHKHAGHSGWRPGGGTHFRLTVVSEAFAGKGRVERQRMIYGLLAEEMDERVHALQIAARTPEEDAAA